MFCDWPRSKRINFRIYPVLGFHQHQKVFSIWGFQNRKRSQSRESHEDRLAQILVNIQEDQQTESEQEGESEEGEESENQSKDIDLMVSDDEDDEEEIESENNKTTPFSMMWQKNKKTCPFIEESM